MTSLLTQVVKNTPGQILVNKAEMTIPPLERDQSKRTLILLLETQNLESSLSRSLMSWVTLAFSFTIMKKKNIHIPQRWTFLLSSAPFVNLSSHPASPLCDGYTQPSVAAPLCSLAVAVVNGEALIRSRASTRERFLYARNAVQPLHIPHAPERESIIRPLMHTCTLTRRLVRKHTLGIGNRLLFYLRFFFF